MPTEAMVAEAVEAARSRGVKNLQQVRHRLIRREQIKAYRKSYNQRTKIQQSEYAKRRRALQPEKHREHLKCHYVSRTPEGKKLRRIKYIYGLTQQAYTDISTQQNHACAICYVKFLGFVSQDIHIDHDHVTGKVRGLLCGNCNRFIGIAKDSIVRLNSAVDYLKRTSAVV